MPPALVPEGTGNASMVHHAGRLHAFSEMALPYELAPNLETLGFPEFAAALPAGAISHPHRIRAAAPAPATPITWIRRICVIT
ncbi:MAG: hypothetical protein U5R48_06795 [Gammaproteobacteria bacterium]|nr:hypothetical protein [Gammaproteobacteria bacterium]